jgi:hypothetical protein
LNRWYGTSLPHFGLPTENYIEYSPTQPFSGGGVRLKNINYGKFSSMADLQEAQAIRNLRINGDISIPLHNSLSG